MPGFNRTGPMGFGPMTGGRRGWCNPAGSRLGPEFRGGGYRYAGALGSGRDFRVGFGPGIGRGRGFGRGYNRYPPADDPSFPQEFASELDMLKDEADFMRESLDAINSRIDEIERRSATSA